MIGVVDQNSAYLYDFIMQFNMIRLQHPWDSAHFEIDHRVITHRHPHKVGTYNLYSVGAWIRTIEAYLNIPHISSKCDSYGQ